VLGIELGSSEYVDKNSDNQTTEVVLQRLRVIIIIIININELAYWNFIAIDGIIRNQLDRWATGCNTQR
jgi:hypothetical protein